MKKKLWEIVMEHVETYKLLKNLIHNELKITRDNIKAWCMEATQQEAKQFIHRRIQQMGFDFLIEKVVRDCVSEILTGNNFTGTNLKKVITEKIAADVYKSIDVSIKKKV